ncbi:GlsB/YeaQ/YmgE family stress response membrane protein [candidate division KSB1 bacterium]|nr:GlsB/YeaQ/YmgE family stress response membrane protein [candidate division KSB1 bacterium]
MNVIWFLVIGLVAGWLSGRLIRGRGFGVLGNLIVGVIGAIVGGFVFDVVGITAYGFTGSLVMAVVGSVLFLFLISFIKRP